MCIVYLRICVCAYRRLWNTVSLLDRTCLNANRLEPLDLDSGRRRRKVRIGSGSLDGKRGKGEDVVIKISKGVKDAAN